MKVKVKKVLIALLLISAVIGLYCAWISYMEKIRNKYPDLSVNSRDSIVYDATEELGTANANYEDEHFNERAEKTEGYAASQHKVSLVFAGLTTPSEMNKILDLLDEYNVKATFACEGVAASEIPDTVNEIKKRGNIIANYGMKREEHWENLDDTELLDTLARTQAVLKLIGGEYPDYAIGNATELNDHILYLTACTGIGHYISATGFLNSSSFKDFGEALF